MLHRSLLLLCLLLCTSLLFGARIYVAPDGMSTGSGNNWANAVTLEEAIAMSQNGDVIWMKRGTYYPQSTISLSSRKDNLSIYGGFLGNETALDQRNYEANPTIIDGQGSVQLFKINSDDFILDGITLQNGYIYSLIHDGPEPRNTGGAAMHVRGSNIILRNLKFLNNTSEAQRGAGALYLFGINTALIDNCLFEGNTLNYAETDSNGGGAIHNWMRDVTISNCVFRNNQSNRPGGAIYTWGQNLVVENTKFINNSSTDIGGAIYINNNDLKIKNALFKGNNSPLGGAIYNNNKLDVTNSTFVDNQNIAIVYFNFEREGTKLYNNIFYNNQSNLEEGLLDVENTSFSSTPRHPIDFRRNIFQENTLGTNSLVGVNPVFVNYASEDYRLQAWSPAIEYGRNHLYEAVSIAPIGNDTDLANNPRRYGIYVDLGAYEFQGEPITPLDCTQLSSPVNNTTSVALDANLTWSASSGATAYYLSIGTTPGGTDILNQENVGNVTTYNPPANFDLNTTYYVTVTPFNTEGSANSCPETSFTTRGPNAPTCSEMTLPTPNATDVSITTDINWNLVTGATDYHVLITDENGVTIYDALVGNVSTLDLTNDLAYATTYTVQITPQNAAGSAENCSSFSFTTENAPLSAPDCTEMTLPAPNATDVSIATNISWNLVASATDYHVLITDENGATIYDALVGNVNTLDLSTDLEYATTYTVLITPQNAAGSAADCSSFSFTTENAPLSAPDCTEMTLPTPNATDVSIATDIIWNLVASATGYHVLITDENGATIYDALVGNVNTLDLGSDLAYATTYTVQITPQNAAGLAENCSSFSFTTENAPLFAPDCTEMTLPTPNATDVSIATDITWNLVTAATDYHVLITDENGVTIYDALVGNVSTFDLTNDLAYATTYTVQITPQNAAGSAENCSSFNFTTEVSEIIIEDETKYGFSPNGDGINDVWVIHGIENYPQNKVSIYNRWGDMVFQIQNYNNSTNVFRGTANRLRRMGADQLPSGTYFFQIENLPEQHHLKKTNGFLVLKR